MEDIPNIDEDALRELASKDGVTHFVAGVAVFRDDKLLVIRRVKDDYLGGLYEIPGGGVDDGETFTAAASRELLEETGLKLSRIIGRIEGFDYKTGTKPKVRQLNYKVEVDPGEVVLEPKEHDEYRWISEDDVDSLEMSASMRLCIKNAF